MTAPRRPGVGRSLGDHESRIRALERQNQLGDRMPWVFLSGNLNGFTAVDGSNSFPSLSGLEVMPLSGGGTVDTAVFGGIDAGGGQVELSTANEPFKAVELLQPGLYSFEVSVIWYLNWGAVRVNYDLTHSDAFSSVLPFRLFLNSTEATYFGGATDASAPQMYLSASSTVAVDERATDVQLRGFVRNRSGVNRTWGTTPGVDVGTFNIFIVQLSASGHSNP